MFSAITLLVLACAVTINAQAQLCIETQIGNVPTPYPVKLETVNLTPFYRDWQITIPPIPGCMLGEAGVSAIICDVDKVLSGQFTNLQQLIVHRNGNIQGTGSVSVTVYCVA